MPIAITHGGDHWHLLLGHKADRSVVTIALLVVELEAWVATHIINDLEAIMLHILKLLVGERVRDHS
jgi:hypothetical protein